MIVRTECVVLFAFVASLQNGTCVCGDVMCTGVACIVVARELCKMIMCATHSSEHHLQML